MRSSIGRALAAAVGLVVLVAPSASAGWWDGGYAGGHDVSRHNHPPGESPGPGREQPPPSSQPGGSYQPPEANLARTATVQGDVYALGVMLYQMVIGDFDQPLGHGWERRLDCAEYILRR